MSFYIDSRIYYVDPSRIDPFLEEVAFVGIDVKSAIKRIESSVAFANVVRARGRIGRPTSKTVFGNTLLGQGRIGSLKTAIDVTLIVPVSLVFQNPPFVYEVTQSYITSRVIRPAARIKPIESKILLDVPQVIWHKSGVRPIRSKVDLFIPPFQLEGRSTIKRIQSGGMIGIPYDLRHYGRIKKPTSKLRTATVARFRGSLKPFESTGLLGFETIINGRGLIGLAQSKVITANVINAAGSIGGISSKVTAYFGMTLDAKGTIGRPTSEIKTAFVLNASGVIGAISSKVEFNPVLRGVSRIGQIQSKALLSGAINIVGRSAIRPIESRALLGAVTTSRRRSLTIIE